MTNDLEEQLRGDLKAASNEVESEVDLDLLVARGRRRRMNRNLRFVVTGVAASLAVGAIGWAGLGRSLAESTSVLATPAPSVRGNDRSASAVFEPLATLPGQQEVGSELSGVARRVEVAAFAGDDGSFGVFVRAVSVAGEVSTGQARSHRGAAVLVQVGPRLVVGLVPHRTDWVHFADQTGVLGGSADSTRPLGDLEATAVCRVLDKAGEYPGLSGYLLRDEAGVYRDAQGEALPRVGLRLPSGEEGEFFVDQGLDQLGFGHGRSSVVIPDREAEPGVFVGESDTAGRVVAGLVLPRGATNPKLRLNGVQPEVKQAELAGRVVVVASAVMTQRGSLIASITYTDDGGRRVTKKSP